jgi:hypothetical protein
METPLTDVTYVAPADIQKELNRIWDELEGKGKMRAFLFNLIIYTQKNRRDTYLQTIAQKVIEQFPSRVIFISVDPESKEDYLKPSVSVLHVGKGDNAIACDLIHIDVAGKAKLERIPFVILPHLLSDVPVYLVWEEDPSFENPIFHQFESYATRIIFDSESSASLQHFAKALLRIHERSNIDIADLNWGRMENWRSLFSAHFLSQVKLDCLKSAKDITINYNALETASYCHTKIQAIYLQAWLACQLNWQFKDTRKEKDNFIFTYISDNREITVTLVPNNFPKLASGIIIFLDITTVNNFHFTFARNSVVPNHIDINVAGPQVCELPSHYIFAKSESGQSLVKEISRRGTSDHYLKVLKLIQGIEALSTC